MTLSLDQYMDYVDDKRVEGYLLGRYNGEHGVFVTNALVKACDHNAYDAILLAQVAYWHSLDKYQKPRLTHRRNGHLWSVKMYDEWAAEVGFKSGRTVEGCFARLAERGLIIKESHKSNMHNGKKVLFVRLHWENFIDALIDANPPVPADNGNGVPANNGNQIPADDGNPYTETTKETTYRERLSSRSDDGASASAPPSEAAAKKNVSAEVESQADTVAEKGSPATGVPLNAYKKESAQRQRRFSKTKRSDKSKAQSRGGGSTRVKADDEGMPAIGRLVLELQNEVAKETGKKQAETLTQNQVELLQTRQRVDGKEVRSLDELYNAVPGVVEKWMKLKIREGALQYWSSPDKIIKRMVKYDMKTFGFVDYIEGTMDDPWKYLRVDGVVYEGTPSTPPPQPEAVSGNGDAKADDDSVWQVSPREAVGYAASAWFWGDYKKVERIRKWVLEVDGYDVYRYLKDDEELPEHLAE